MEQEVPEADIRGRSKNDPGMKNNELLFESRFLGQMLGDYLLIDDSIRAMVWDIHRDPYKIILPNMNTDVLDLDEIESNMRTKKRLVGRPPKWTDPEALEKRINEYFDLCDAHIEVTPNLMYEEEMDEYMEKIQDWNNLSDKQKVGKYEPIKPLKEWRKQRSQPYSITGLALFIGCATETLTDYREKDEFSDSITKAYMRVKQGYEHRLNGTAPTGAIFALKNFGWTDKSELTGGGGQPLFPSVPTLTPEQIRKIGEEMVRKATPALKEAPKTPKKK